MESKLNYPSWLTEDLIVRIRKLYEPRYNYVLSDKEVTTIALSLSSLVELYLKFKRRTEHGI